MKRNFTAFVDLAGTLTGQSVSEIERVTDDGVVTRLDAKVLAGVDTLIIISFNSLRSGQSAAAHEVDAVLQFLAQPDHLAFVCPHHDIGDVPELPHDDRLQRQIADFLHHGDKTIPPQQQFGGFARSLLSGIGVPVGPLRPPPRGRDRRSPSPIEKETGLDRLHLLQEVDTFNLHWHLPQLERLGEALAKLDVLARQRIDLAAPPHPFTRVRTTFDALLQSRPEVFAGTLLVSDATLWSSTAGGVDSLTTLWTNVLRRAYRSAKVT